MTYRLPAAVRPAPGAAALCEGYRLDTYRNPDAGLCIPALAAAVSRDKLFDAFLALLEPLGDVVDVVLETSHSEDGDHHRDLRRERVDRPVLASYFCEYEGLLLEDGCTGVAVIATERPMEVQFDEHKQIVCYAHNLRPFRRVLKQFDVPRRQDMRLVSEGPHLHHSRPGDARRFRELALRLGADAALAISN